MDRAARLDATLRELMSGDTPFSALDGDDALAFGLLSLRSTWRGEFATAAGAACEALARAGDPESLTLARAAAGLCIASWADCIHDPALRDPRTGTDPLLAARDDPQSLDAEFEQPLIALLAEGALACARLDLATELLELGTAAQTTLFGDPRHPFLTFTRVLQARIRAFQGDVSGALLLAESAVDSASSTVELVFAGSCAALVRGNADQRAETRRLVDLVASGQIAPADALSRGCFVLAAYGAEALGDLDRAAELMLRGGGGPDLERLRIIDRALGLELLAAAAVADHDLDAARSWLDRALPLAGHPVAGSTVNRIRSRVALLAGDARGAVEHASASIERAQTDGRGVETAEGTILLARARLALNQRGAATRALTTSAHHARKTGHLAVLRSAARELRRVGRRLPPEAESGWDGLSIREREVATLLAEGLSNAEVAEALFLSEHTVRVHVSRVLYAFSVPTRAGVAAALAVPTPQPVSTLTPRRRQVVEHLVAGRSNRQIAENLGIGLTTVEKHVAAILRQWQVGSRAGIVRMALAGSIDSGASRGTG